MIYWCVGCMLHIVEKFLIRATILLQISFQSKVYTKHYGPPKLQESPFQEFRNSQLGSPITKWHLGARLVGRHTEYYKGEGDGFPKSGLWWILWVVFAHGSFLHQKCSNYALINLLFGLCRFVWIIDSLITCPSPYPGALACLSIPELMRTMECTPIHYPFVIFTFRFIIESIKEFGGASP